MSKNDMKRAGSFRPTSPVYNGVEVIEDEPEKIDLIRLLKRFLRSWKVLVILMVICGAVWGILRPGTSHTSFGARCTIYIPPYTSRMIDDRQVTVSNNTSQISNAIGLIQSKVYRDVVAQELGTDSLASYGSYSVSRTKDTELITINAVGSDEAKAEELCSAVLDVFQSSVGSSVSINSMMVVDPVTGYSNVTASSTISSIFKGMIGGFVLYCIFIVFKLFTDRTIHSKEDAEDYFDIPVLCVVPDLGKDMPQGKKRS